MKKIVIDKNLKYGLYILAAIIGGYVIVKIIKSIKDNAGNGDDDDTPKPIEPIKPDAAKAAGLTTQQIKIEELQSLLGFVGADIDHDIGKNTKKRYNDLNLGLNITLSNSTSTEDLQKIINKITAKNLADKQKPIYAATRERARVMVQSWAKNPTGVLAALKTTKLVIVNLDKTNNKYIATNQIYTYGTNDKFTREQLGVLKQASGFNHPYYVFFKNSLGTTLLANPNDWIIK